MLHCEVNIRTRCGIDHDDGNVPCSVSGVRSRFHRRSPRPPSLQCYLPQTRAPRRQKRGTGQRPPVSQLPAVPLSDPPDDRITVDGALVHRQCAPHWTRLVGPPPEEPAAPAVRDYEADRQRARQSGNGANARRQFFAGLLHAESIAHDERQAIAARHQLAADVRFIRAGFRFLDRDAKERASQVRTTARTRAMLRQPPPPRAISGVALRGSRRSISRAAPRHPAHRARLALKTKLP